MTEVTETASEPDVDGFLTAFDALAQAIRRARGATAQQAEQLSLSQFALLQPLAVSDAVRVSELAAGAGIAPSTATRILDALERRELVRRAQAPDDRRGVTVSLTPEGRRMLGRQIDWMLERRHAFYAALPVAEQELVPDLLVRLAALIDELAAGPSA